MILALTCFVFVFIFGVVAGLLVSAVHDARARARATKRLLNTVYGPFGHTYKGDRQV